jgi:hypothetical protein
VLLQMTASLSGISAAFFTTISPNTINAYPPVTQGVSR